MSGETWLKRKEALNLIISLDYPVTYRQLEHMAAFNNAGGGPPFTRSGWRTVRYKREDVIDWVGIQKAKNTKK